MPRKSFFIQESELDDYQFAVLHRRANRPFIVEGCAGSGKSILALHKVKQIQEQNMGSFYFILFTKTLKQYMQDGIDTIGLRSDRVTYFWHWKNRLGAPSADYIIVDEAQDFTEEDIELFKSKANKALILYGDSAQQIYKFRVPPPIPMDKIAVLTGFPKENLTFNHRLPKKIARLAEKIGDIDELVIRCRTEGAELPKILEYPNLNAQLDAIIEIIRNRQLEDVGVFFRRNDEVEKAKQYFESKGLKVEAKYNQSMDLDFTNDLPKLTTYHSSKGLQFEAVFIPNCNVEDEADRIPLYVAITRTYQSLFIMHSGDLSSFFDDVPTDLYETSLVSKTTRRL